MLYKKNLMKNCLLVVIQIGLDVLNHGDQIQIFPLSLEFVEAKYQSIGYVVSKFLWIQGLLKELGVNQHKPSILYCDNKVAI